MRWKVGEIMKVYVTMKLLELVLYFTQQMFALMSNTKHCCFLPHASNFNLVQTQITTDLLNINVPTCGILLLLPESEI